MDYFGVLESKYVKIWDQSVRSNMPPKWKMLHLKDIRNKLDTLDMKYMYIGPYVK
jgi:hypothetical protein